MSVEHTVRQWKMKRWSPLLFFQLPPGFGLHFPPTGPQFTPSECTEILNRATECHLATLWVGWYAAGFTVYSNFNWLTEKNLDKRRQKQKQKKSHHRTANWLMFLFQPTEQNVSAPARRKGRRARWRKLGTREKLPADPATMSLPQSITSPFFSASCLPSTSVRAST